ncbi:hypothetical protein [Rossellomorea sp. KS-H15a]|uniref:hypothetical protein n=1 Tax=Rossellomorea sp. KS-H15a TaxID=2963940 RepID=UPI0020C6B770|nr:hypothetical protein [Rossellomorea sp. KS-H15a]UTE78487.1 hypothetical protein M1J35_06890 [Rossellomorea sp. KS-H15a]
MNNLDDGKVKNIMRRIVELEKDNLRTKKYRKEEMLKKIQKIIEEEVKKNVY